jgi:hypothetical protein
VIQALPYACLTLWVLFADAWFRGPLLGALSGRVLLASLGALLTSALVVAGLSSTGASTPPRRFLVAVAGLLLLATLVRLPALLAPSSVISGDSAVNGIVAHELRTGAIAPPVYPPGYPYEGTLKVNLTAALGRLFTGIDTPTIYVWAGHAFYLLWMTAAMMLARRAGGDVAVLGAGLFLAVSPRFLTAFSVNNVGQYQELNALGALGLALLSGGSVLGAAFAIGLAVWQQLVAFYFVLVLLAALVLTPSLRTPRALRDAVAGFGAGTYPIWIWNVANGWATFDFFRRGTKGGLGGRMAEWPTQLGRTLATSFPKLFGATDLGLDRTAALLAALVLPSLVLVLAWTCRKEIREQRGRSAAALAVLLFAVGLSVFTVSKFSRRGIQRPRYLLPLYTPVAVAAGFAFARLAARSKAAAGAAAALVLGWNAAGLAPWLLGRPLTAAHDREVLERLQALGVRRGHAGFTVATRYTFLSGNRMILAGDLGPEVDWVYAPHAVRVEQDGADAYLTDRADLVPALARRFTELGVAFSRTDGVPTVFHHFSRKVELSELDGYDAGATSTEEGSENE